MPRLHQCAEPRWLFLGHDAKTQRPAPLHAGRVRRRTAPLTAREAQEQDEGGEAGCPQAQSEFGGTSLFQVSNYNSIVALNM